MVRGLALGSRGPGFKTRSDHLLNLILVVPGSTSQLHLQTANWFASGQLGFLTVVVVILFRRFVVSLALKSPYGERSIKYALYCIVLVMYPECFIASWDALVLLLDTNV